MPSSSAVHRSLLVESRAHIYRSVIRSRIRRFGVHPINRERENYGEFHHLYLNLRRFPDRFWQYCRMSVPSFDLLLEKVRPKLTRQKKAISPEQRLVLCLRLVFFLIFLIFICILQFIQYNILNVSSYLKFFKIVKLCHKWQKTFEKLKVITILFFFCYLFL